MAIKFMYDIYHGARLISEMPVSQKQFIACIAG